MAISSENPKLFYASAATIKVRELSAEKRLSVLMELEECVKNCTFVARLSGTKYLIAFADGMYVVLRPLNRAELRRYGVPKKLGAYLVAAVYTESEYMAMHEPKGR